MSGKTRIRQQQIAGPTPSPLMEAWADTSNAERMEQLAAAGEAAESGLEWLANVDVWGAADPFVDAASDGAEWAMETHARRFDAMKDEFWTGDAPPSEARRTTAGELTRVEGMPKSLSPEAVDGLVKDEESGLETGVRTGLMSGRLAAGRETRFETGTGTVSVQQALDFWQGRAGAGVAYEDEATGAKAGIRGGVDVTADGGLEALSGGVSLEHSKVSVEVGAGLRDGVSAPEKLSDGRYRVTWDLGAGARTGVGLSEGKMGLGGAASTMLSRTFESEEDAKKFAEAAKLQGIPSRAVDRDLLATMKPGETFAIESGADGTVDLSPKMIVEGTGKANAGVSTGMELEKLDGERVRARTTSGWSLSGSVGLSAQMLGWKGELGIGGESNMEVDFDLSKPGAREAFETFQRTGELPEGEVDGVAVQGGKSIGYDMWSNASQLFATHLKQSGRVEAGTISTPDGMEDYHRGERKESHTREYFWGTKHEVASEQHVFETVGSTLTGRSEYKGYEAQAHLEDDLSATTDIGDGRTAYGGTGGEYTVDTLYTPLARGELGHRLSKRAITTDFKGPDVRFKTEEATHKYGFDELVARVAHSHEGTDDLAALAKYVAVNGGEAMDALRNNTASEQTFVRAEGSDGMLGLPGYQAMEARISDLEAQAASGQLDPASIVDVRGDLREQLAALHDEKHPLTAKEVERARLMELLDRLAGVE